MKLFKIDQKGQVAIIVLLVSAAVMTLGLSISKKTVIDTKIDTSEEQLKQAFNTAESGIDYYLGTGSTKFVAPDSQSVADVVVKNVGQGTTINFNQYNLVNKSQEYWMMGHLASGSMDQSTYYGGSSLSICVENAFNGALRVDYFYLDAGSAYQVYHAGYNFSSGYVNGFTDLSPLPPTGGCTTGYREISLSTPLGGGIKPILLSVRPMRTGTKMYILGSGSVFPIQGIELSSTGKVGDATTGVNRKINVTRLYQVPGFALDAVTTFGSVLSN
jgi:hypothetical protein